MFTFRKKIILATTVFVAMALTTVVFAASLDSDNFETYGAWTFDTSGGCNRDGFAWDPLQYTSQWHSYYLRAGSQAIGVHDCRAHVTKTFTLDVGNFTNNTAPLNVSWMYRSEQGASTSRYFNVYVDNNQIWSKNSVAAGNWNWDYGLYNHTFENGTNTTDINIKLEVFYDDAYTASTSGWYDDLVVDSY